MKWRFATYVLWPLAKRVQNWIVDRSTARELTVFQFLPNKVVHFPSTFFASSSHHRLFDLFPLLNRFLIFFPSLTESVNFSTHEQILWVFFLNRFFDLFPLMNRFCSFLPLMNIFCSFLPQSPHEHIFWIFPLMNRFSYTWNSKCLIALIPERNKKWGWRGWWWRMGHSQCTLLLAPRRWRAVLTGWLP